MAGTRGGLPVTARKLEDVILDERSHLRTVIAASLHTTSAIRKPRTANQPPAARSVSVVGEQTGKPSPAVGQPVGNVGDHEWVDVLRLFVSGRGGRVVAGEEQVIVGVVDPD